MQDTNTPLYLNMVFRLEIDGSKMLSFHGILLVLPNALASIQCIFSGHSKNCTYVVTHYQNIIFIYTFLLK
jgi:hypothetical protein